MVKIVELELACGHALFCNVDTNHVPIPSCANRCHREIVRPEFTASKFSSEIRTTLE